MDSNKTEGCDKLLWILVMLCTVRCGGTTVLSVITSVLTDERFPDDVLKLAIDSCDALPIELIFSRTRADEPKHLYMNVFTSSVRKIYRVHDVRRLLIENPKINSFRETTIYVHGWRNHPMDESSQAIVSALLRRDTNVLLFDTSKYMNELYLTASSYVLGLGQVLNKFLIKLTDKVPPKKINLVGFSLGAHVAGVAGNMFQRQTGKSLERITALDPAKPCFERLEDHRLGKEDAKHVEVIHTSPGSLGLREPLGHADFYVNGVSGNQPECKQLLIKLECNHAQAWKVFSAAVERPGMLATACGNWKELKNKECNGYAVDMVYNSPNATRGLFYVSTRKRLSRKQRHSEPVRMKNSITWVLSRFGLV